MYCATKVLHNNGPINIDRQCSLLQVRHTTMGYIASAFIKFYVYNRPAILSHIADWFIACSAPAWKPSYASVRRMSRTLSCVLFHFFFVDKHTRFFRLFSFFNQANSSICFRYECRTIAMTSPIFSSLCVTNSYSNVFYYTGNPYSLRTLKNLDLAVKIRAIPVSIRFKRTKSLWKFEKF